MSLSAQQRFDLRYPDRFFIGGEWVSPSTMSTFEVINPATERVQMRVVAIGRRLQSGTVGHNAFRGGDFTVGFGGFKQSGVGREGGVEGLLPYCETKAMLLDDAPSRLD